MAQHRECLVRSLRKSFGLVVAALIGLTGSAFASDLPRWDMRQFCAGRVALTGVEDCVRAQHEARERVRVLWAQADADEKAECLSWLADDDIPPSYLRLDHCLESKARGR